MNKKSVCFQKLFKLKILIEIIIILFITNAQNFTNNNSIYFLTSGLRHSGQLFTS